LEVNTSRYSLRLQIYKGLGFEPVIDKRGNMTKMLVSMYSSIVPFIFLMQEIFSSDAQSGDIHSVEFTGEKTNLEYTQLLWKLAAS
jgi:kinetochore protein Spc24, fungi type